MLRDYNGNAIGHITYLGAVELTFMGITWYIHCMSTPISWDRTPSEVNVQVK